MRRRLWPLAALCVVVFFCGCNHFHHRKTETIYVSARRIFLRDRVAAVSARVAEVENGQPLEVLEHGRRFYKVKTAKGQIGWIEEHAIIDGKTYATFAQLAADHKQDPVVATATLRDDLYMHVAAGREADHFYLLPGNTKVQLLIRASVPRQGPPGYAPPRPATVDGKTEVPPIPMEDWWLARDSQGRTGWLLGSRVDVDAPEEIEGYCEGQRIVGAWKIATVTDPDSGAPNHQVPEYLTILSPPKSGLPFDFDQVRVFTWSLRHHRYETGFRLHPVQGFLPVQISSASVNGRTVPVFSFQIPGSQNVAIDPATGITRPADPRTIRYEMIDTQVKRIGPDLAPLPSSRTAGKKSATRPAHKRK